MKTLKLSDYYEIRRPTYVYLKIVPDSSIRNYNSSSIAKSMALLYRNVFQMVKRENKKIFIETNFKLSYFIDITKTDISFYFIVPLLYKDRIKEKIRNTWKRCTVEEVAGIKEFSSNAVKYQLYTAKENALSLEIDKKNNEPLNSICNIVEDLNEGDRVGVFYNFIPMPQDQWKYSYQKTINKLQDGKSVYKDVTVSGVLINIVSTVCDILKETFSLVFGAEPKTINENLGFLESAMGIVKNYNLSPETEKKKDTLLIKGQIVVLSEVQDKQKADSKAISLCQSFRGIEGDNMLKYKPLKEDKKTTVNITDYKIVNAEESVFSVEECGNFIQLAGRELQERFGMINRIETMETEVPKELQSGNISIGVNIHKGKETKAYLTTDKEYQYLTLCIVAPTRSGKSTLIENIANDSIKAGECVINFDFCGKCKLSDDLNKVIAKEKVMNIDCNNHDKLEGLGFNEITYNGDDMFLKYRSAKEQSTLLAEFIDSINISNPLEPRMLRYLKAAAIITFYQKKSTGDALDILEDHVKRNEYIENVKDVLELQKQIKTLKEIDDYNKQGELTGTKLSFIQGILNRADIIRSNAYMELMLDRPIDNNINLIDEMQKNQLINLKIKESMFKTELEKDIYCLYWLVKIWGALQERMEQLEDDKMKKVNLLIDELYQVPLTQTFLKTKLNQIAKKRCKPIISCHSLEQIKYIRPELKSANTSYILIAGCTKDNYKELQEELYPYELEDLLNLKRYTSLNLIKTENSYSTFITKLPPPIKS